MPPVKFLSFALLAVVAICLAVTQPSKPVEADTQNFATQEFSDYAIEIVSNPANWTPSNSVTPATPHPRPTPDPDVMASFRPATPETCNCEDCLTESDVRSIVRDEIEKFKTQFRMVASETSTSSGGSTGGSLSTSPAVVVQSQPVVRRQVTRTRAVAAEPLQTCVTDANGVTTCTTQPQAYQTRSFSYQSQRPAGPIRNAIRNVFGR